MVKVTFEYDEPAQKWDVWVDGCEEQTEAVQAFNAVLLTAQQARAHMRHRTVMAPSDRSSTGKRFKIVVGL